MFLRTSYVLNISLHCSLTVFMSKFLDVFHLSVLNIRATQHHLCTAYSPTLCLVREVKSFQLDQMQCFETGLKLSSENTVVVVDRILFRVPMMRPMIMVAGWGQIIHRCILLIIVPLVAALMAWYPLIVLRHIRAGRVQLFYVANIYTFFGWRWGDQLCAFLLDVWTSFLLFLTIVLFHKKNKSILMLSSLLDNIKSSFYISNYFSFGIAGQSSKVSSASVCCSQEL